MSVDPAEIVKRYLDTVLTGTADDIAALYADDATLEDPVGGGEVHIGRQAIAGFYKALETADTAVELLQLRVGGHEAAFIFAITVTAGETKMRIEPIETMVFNGEGKIASMKAYWSPDDIKML
ncbi:MAG: nuclear transport factor 2 family protein [Mycobacterium sp.]